MSLFRSFYEPFLQQTVTEADNGLLGRTVTLEDGKQFQAALTNKASLDVKHAQKDDVSESYLITCDIGTGLKHGDIVKRGDGSLYKITTDSTDTQTPGVCSFRFEQVQAERWASV